MAEVYTVVMSNQAPTEITGGRVGHFRINPTTHQSTMFLGSSDLAVTYPGGTASVANGAVVYGQPPQPLELYVTSPEVFVLFTDYFDGNPLTEDLVIFHNR